MRKCGSGRLPPLVEVRELPGSRVWSPVALSSDGRWLARGGYGISVWELGTEAVPVIATDQFTEAVAFGHRQPDDRRRTATPAGS